MRLIKSSLTLLLSTLDACLKILVRPKPRQICYNSTPTYSDNSYHLYQYTLRNREGIDHVWLVDDDSQTERLQTEFQHFKAANPDSKHRLRVLQKLSIAGYFSYLRSIACFHTHGIYFFSRRPYKRYSVCLWHGMPIKVIAKLNLTRPNQKPTIGTHFIASSEFFRHIISNCFSQPYNRVILTQQPRCDVLTHPQLRLHSDDSVRAQLGLRPNQKFILWMPTYRTERVDLKSNSQVRTFVNDVADNLLDELISQAKRQNYTLVVKLHPFDLLNNQPFPRQADNLKVITGKQWQDLSIPLYEALAVSSALITDISSVAIDYLLTKKNIGIVGFDQDTYTREVLFPPEWLMHCPSAHRIDQPSQIYKLFEEPKAIDQEPFSEIFNAPSSEPGAETILRHLLL